MSKWLRQKDECPLCRKDQKGRRPIRSVVLKNLIENEIVPTTSRADKRMFKKRVVEHKKWLKKHPDKDSDDEDDNVRHGAFAGERLFHFFLRQPLGRQLDL